MTWVIANMKDILHYLGHAILMPVAMWLWNERRTLKEVLEDGLERRHENKGDTMLNPLTILQDLTLVSKAATTLEQALPLLNKTVNDVRIAYAQKGDAIAEEAALAAVLTDIQNAITGLAALFPPPAEISAPVATPPPPPAA